MGIKQLFTAISLLMVVLLMSCTATRLSHKQAPAQRADVHDIYITDPELNYDDNGWYVWSKHAGYMPSGVVFINYDDTLWVDDGLLGVAGREIEPHKLITELSATSPTLWFRHSENGPNSWNIFTRIPVDPYDQALDQQLLDSYQTFVEFGIQLVDDSLYRQGLGAWVRDTLLSMKTDPQGLILRTIAWRGFVAHIYNPHRESEHTVWDISYYDEMTGGRVCFYLHGALDFGDGMPYLANHHMYDVWMWWAEGEPLEWNGRKQKEDLTRVAELIPPR